MELFSDFINDINYSDVPGNIHNTDAEEFCKASSNANIIKITNFKILKIAKIIFFLCILGYLLCIGIWFLTDIFPFMRSWFWLY